MEQYDHFLRQNPVNDRQQVSYAYLLNHVADAYLKRKRLMAAIDRLYTTYYRTAVVTIALCYTFIQLSINKFISDHKDL